MCIIAIQTPEAELSTDELRQMYDNNPHGFGAMWFENGEIQTEKGLYDFQDIMSFYRNFNGDLPLAMHMRWVTRGYKSNHQCHPFAVGDNIAFMHNGTFYDVTYDKSKSDTQMVAETLEGLLDGNGRIDWLDDDDNLEDFFAIDGSFNRLAFLFKTETGHASWRLVNRSKWYAPREGLLLSNSYSLKSNYRNYRVIAGKPATVNKETKKFEGDANLFVYGSLKRGYGNNVILGDSKFLGRTYTKYPKFVMSSATALPGVFPIVAEEKNGFRIEGELYRVDRDTLRYCDYLESNGDFYTRKLVRLKNGARAWMYLVPRGMVTPEKSLADVFFVDNGKRDTLTWLAAEKPKYYSGTGSSYPYSAYGYGGLGFDENDPPFDATKYGSLVK